MLPPKSVRNLALIAHIDHGKSTLADRFLEISGAVGEVVPMSQLLDSHPIERERGITIKLAPVRIKYRFCGNDYIINLIDTPGHVDFSYEVSRALAACEAAILIVDAASGIQAQTLSNLNQARRLGLKIIPVINKIDLNHANTKETVASVARLLNVDQKDCFLVSAKTGENVKTLFENLITLTPPPQGRSALPLRALVFNSFYDEHLGVVVFVKLVDGSLGRGEEISFYRSQVKTKAFKISYLTPEMKETDSIFCGEVACVSTGLKDPSFGRIGDTLISLRSERSQITPLPGYQQPRPVVFYNLFSTDQRRFEDFQKALFKLRLIDSSLDVKKTSSYNFGQGYRCGFLGVFHAEIVVERLERDYDISLITSAPQIEYRIKIADNKGTEDIIVSDPADYPDPSLIKQVLERQIEISIYSPFGYLGSLMTLVANFRGTVEQVENLGLKNYDKGELVVIKAVVPLAEFLAGFDDKLKSVSSGFASYEYQLADFAPVEAVRLDVYLNKKRIEGMSMLVCQKNAQVTAQQIAKRIQKTIPRHQFLIPIQVMVGGKVLARENIKPFRKDVTAKLYGGDQTRKDKLLKKQKKGKKKMRTIGNVQVPSEAFLAVFQARTTRDK